MFSPTLLNHITFGWNKRDVIEYFSSRYYDIPEAGPGYHRAERRRQYQHHRERSAASRVQPRGRISARGVLD